MVDVDWFGGLSVIMAGVVLDWWIRRDARKATEGALAFPRHRRRRHR